MPDELVDRASQSTAPERHPSPVVLLSAGFSADQKVEPTDPVASGPFTLERPLRGMNEVNVTVLGGQHVLALSGIVFD